MRLHAFMSRALNSAALLALIVAAGLAINGVLLAYAAIRQVQYFDFTGAEECAADMDENGGALSQGLKEKLSEDGCFVMELDGEGKVIYQYEKPSELPESYSIADVAMFTRWYLGDYPVRVHTRGDGLLVLGYPKGSVWKYNVENAMPTLTFWPLWVGAVLLCNFLLVFLISYFYIDRSYKKRDAARTEWIAAVSHDVRTPLATVLGYSASLEQDESLPERSREHAALIRQKGEELRRLIENLNLTNRLQHSMEPLHREKLSMAALVREVLVSYLNDEQNAAFSFTADISPAASLLLLNGDRALLRRLLANLVGNSVSHNPSGCDVSVALRAKGRTLCLSVSDNGCGYSEEQLKKLKGKTPELSSGHGLGLGIVRQIARAHGGRIGFANAPTGGSVCTVVFPHCCRVRQERTEAQIEGL